MKLTNDEKLALATKLCEMQSGLRNYYSLKGPYVCHISDFDPVNNWNHMRLVMEGLVKKTMEKFTAFSKDKAFRIVLHKLATMPEVTDKNWLGNVVCAYGLEMLGKKSQETKKG